MTLLRPEAVEAQRRRLFGTVTLHQPVALPIFTGLLAAATVALVGFVCLASFATKETVRGAIVPQAGLSDVVATRAGVVSEIFAQIDAPLEMHSPVMAISDATAVTKGGLSGLQAAEVRIRIGELDLQLSSQGLQADAERKRITERMFASRREIVRLRNSLALQERQLALADNQLTRIEPLVRQGYMSELERDRRSQAVLGQRQAIEDINRAIESREADIVDAKSQLAGLEGRTATERSQIRSAKSSLLQNLDEIDAQGRSLVRSPIRGRLTALRVYPGTPVTSGSLLATLTPIDSPLRAEVVIPTRAAGFVSEGQQVRLMVDAFPYQRFGMIEGVVRQIQRAPVPPQTDASSSQVSGYRALIDIKRPHVMAYGQRRNLQSGMTVTADIVTGRRTLLQSVTDPLKAAQRLR